MCILTSLHVYICMCVYMYMYMYVYIYVCVCVWAGRPPTYSHPGRLFMCNRVGGTDAGGSARPTERRPC